MKRKTNSRTAEILDIYIPGFMCRAIPVVALLAYLPVDILVG